MTLNMVTDTTSLVVGIVCWSIMHVIILPYDIYWCYQFWKQRQELIIKKREPVLFIIFSTAVSIFLFLAMTSIMIQYEVRDYNTSPHMQYIFNEAYFLAYMPFLWVTVLVGVGRYWIIFYKMKHTQAIINNKWQSVLDPNIGKQNWYLKNVKTWGSRKYIQKWLVIYIIIGYLCSNVGYVITDNLISWMSLAGYAMFALFCLLTPMTMFVFILCKIPAFKDDIGIKSEIRYCLWVLILMIVINIIFVPITRYQSANGQTAQSNLIHIEWYAMTLFTRVVATCITLRSTRSIMKRYDEMLHGRYGSEPINMMALAQEITYAKLSKDGDDTYSKNNGIESGQDITDALKTQALFDAFMEQLFSEYCAECLLSIVEFMQYKSKMKEEFQDVEFKDDQDIMSIELPEKIVRSRIVYDNSDYKRMASKLYEKYIQVSAEWGININYRDRNRYQKLFDGDSITDDSPTFNVYQ